MKKYLLFCGLSLVTSSAFSAKTAPGSENTLTSAIQVLNLPGENRRMLVQVSGERHYDQFVTLAFDESRPMSLRWRALMAAADARGKGATSDLVRASKSAHWYMRNASLVGLKEISSPEAEKVALQLVGDKALVVRSAAIEVLKDNASTEVRERLWQELNKDYNFKKKQSLWVRHQIVQALAAKPLDKERVQFATLLQDPDGLVQVSSIRGLERLTGVKLGDDKLSSGQLVSQWREYMKKETFY